MTIQRSRIQWLASSLGASFGYYLVERLRTDAVTWDEIAHVMSEATTQFNDYEPERNVNAQYRFKVVRADGATSAGQTASLIPGPAATRWTIACNEDTSLNIEFDAVAPFTAGFPDNSVTYRMYGRDGAVRFHATEDPLDEFDLNVEIYDTSHTGRPIFDDLLDVCRADVSQVTLLDPYGNRWFCTVSMDAGTAPDVRQHFGYVTLHVVETVRWYPTIVEV